MASAIATVTRRMGRIAAAHLNFEAVWVLFILSTYMLRAVDCAGNNPHHGTVDLEDNEFAEFEDFDEGTERAQDTEETERKTPGQPPTAPPKEEKETVKEEKEKIVEEEKPTLDDELEGEDGIVEEETDEFAHLKDDEEFENYENLNRPTQGSGGKDSFSQDSSRSGGKPQKLEIVDVPAHLRNNWSNYQVELLMIFGLSIYLLNYIYGKTKNQSLAQAWFDAHREFLENQFTVVGDDGTSVEVESGCMLKETDSGYCIWCSGRSGCKGMLIRLQMLKRQDLVSIMSLILRPKYDQVLIRVDLDPDEMDSFVFAVGQKKTLTKLGKEMTDLMVYSAEKKNADRFGLPSNFTILSEIAEATSVILDPKVVQIINAFAECIDYIHFSDQYSGTKPQEGETQSKLPEPTRVMFFCFNIPGKLGASDRHVEYTKPLMNLVFHCLEKGRRFRLSREGKQKADRNRQLAQESFLKSTHLARQEAAQLKREEKIKERKERLMNEEDPDKQRKLEKIEQKREAKKKQPKMKQLKVKAM